MCITLWRGEEKIVNQVRKTGKSQDMVLKLVKYKQKNAVILQGWSIHASVVYRAAVRDD